MSPSIKNTPKRRRGGLLYPRTTCIEIVAKKVDGHDMDNCFQFPAGAGFFFRIMLSPVRRMEGESFSEIKQLQYEIDHSSSSVKVNINETSFLPASLYLGKGIFTIPYCWQHFFFCHCYYCYLSFIITVNIKINVSK